MNRRKFLKNGSLAGLAFSTIASFPKELSAEQSTQKPAKLLDLGDEVINIEEITIDDLQAKMKDGVLTSRLMVEAYLNRINSIDKKGHSINAVLEINPEALAIAAQMDAERKNGKVRGPLHGIPVLIKDNIDTGDQMITSAGSLALIKNRAAKDAFIIQQLRASGAVILGKTNLSEWANFRSTKSSSGWSSRGGQTRNPYILDRSPSGSSSGSAAAVSANLCVVAIGTETDGSVISPASSCGIVGIKPTVGLLSRNGIIPISKTQDTAGPMARTVKDAAILLSALTGIDEADAITKESSTKNSKDYTLAFASHSLKGKRIGIEKSFLTGHEGVVSLYIQAIDDLKKLGAKVIEVELMKSIREIGDAEFIVLQYEFKDGLNKYLNHSKEKLNSLSDIIHYNKSNEATAMPFFKQEILELCETKDDLSSKEYTDSLQKTLSSRKIIDELMQENKLDAIAGVSSGIPWCIDVINGDYDTGFSFSTPAALAGYPHITVPMGFVHELPVGLSFMSGAYREMEILGFAYEYEQATKKRQPPKFIKTSIPS